MANDPLRFDVNVEPSVSVTIADQADVIIRQIGNGIVGEMKRLMSLPKTGRTYRRGVTALHVASAPGQAPAVDTGNLTNSISFRMVGPLNGKVAINADYAAYLEYGTRYMASRPYIQPAIDQTIADFRQAGILRGAR